MIALVIDNFDLDGICDEFEISGCTDDNACIMILLQQTMMVLVYWMILTWRLMTHMVMDGITNNSTHLLNINGTNYGHGDGTSRVGLFSYSHTTMSRSKCM